jgi:hypothetical protein
MTIASIIRTTGNPAKPVGTIRFMVQPLPSKFITMGDPQESSVLPFYLAG